MGGGNIPILLRCHCCFSGCSNCHALVPLPTFLGIHVLVGRGLFLAGPTFDWSLVICLVLTCVSVFI